MEEMTIKAIKARAASICSELTVRVCQDIRWRNEFLHAEGKAPDWIDHDIAALEWLIKTIAKAINEI